MRRRHHHRRWKEAPELDITSFLNLMVVLIPFLLISAVFSRVTIQELSVPTSSGPAATNVVNFSIEVIVRDAGLELANGSTVEVAIPNVDGDYNLTKLSELLQRLKATYPEKEDATVLLEPGIAYDYLIQVMDTMRGAQIEVEGSDEAQKVVLFPQISIGDAP